MFERKVIHHVSVIRKKLKSLQVKSLIAFGAMCAERQLPVYVKASANTTWQNESTMAQVLDAIWNWLIFQTEIPPHLTKNCERGLELEDEIQADGVGRDIGVSFSCLLDAVGEFNIENFPETIANVAFVAETSVNVIEDLLSVLIEQSAMNSEVITRVDSDELMALEMKKQINDLTIVADELDNVKYRELRTANRDQSIFGEFWFPHDY